MVTASELRVVDGHEQALALLDPTRQRLLEELRRPSSAVELARRTGLTRQLVGHHVRVLERQGFLELVEERRKRGCTERVLRARAGSYLLSPAVLGGVGTRPQHVRDRFSWAYLVAVAARTIRELAVLRKRADRAGQGLATLSIDTEVRFADAESQRAFGEELATEVARLAAKYDDRKAAQGRTFRVVGGAYPKITKKNEEKGDE